MDSPETAVSFSSASLDKVLLRLSENLPSFTITVTSEAEESDETVQTILKSTYSKKYLDEAPF